MKKLLTGLALVLMLSGCGPTPWTNADVYTALTFCAKHRGLRELRELPETYNGVVCNDGTYVSRNKAYEEVYKSNYP